MTVDELKRLFGFTEDQELAPIFDLKDRSTVSKWRKNGAVPASIEKKTREMLGDKHVTLSGYTTRPPEAIDVPPHTKTIPIISWAQAGTDGFFEDAYEVGGGIGRLNWFDDIRDDNAYALVIRGDSMIPRYDPGDYVIVSPAAGVKSGDYAIVKLRDGQVLAKQVKSRNGEFVLSSVNPAYDDLYVPAADVVFTHKIVGTRPGG